MSLHKDFAITLARTLAGLLLMPLITLWFISYTFQDIQKDWDKGLEKQLNATRNTGRYISGRGLEKVPVLSAEEQQELRDFHALTAVAGLCRNPHPEVAEVRAEYCQPFGDLWQFTWMRTAAWIALVAGVLLLACLVGLGVLAHARRHWQYTSFVLGWRTLTTASVIIVVLQGSMIAWLSYWMTVVFTNSYAPKLIIFISMAAAWAVFEVIRRIFQRPDSGSAIAGEVVSEANAPHLWQRIREMAQRLKTRAPDHVVAGIDANFFVTEAPLHVAGGASGKRVLSGRKLYVSIPLLRQLERQEADAVLAHELAHLSGGDAKGSAQLGPRLDQFGRYMGHLHEYFGTRWLILPFFVLYRMIFELALAKDSRAREFRADRHAAKLVSPQAVTRALVKIGAYANYRDAVEQGLFEHSQQLDGKLGIGERVANGLSDWANTPAFAQALTKREIPHPYDSHPPLAERMRNVGHVEPPEQFAAIVTRPVADTWADDIRTAAQIEAQLWGGYEEDFAANHEEALAIRYEPANEAERVIVLKYFPDQSFALRKGRSITVTYEGVIGPDGKMLARWKEVKACNVVNIYFLLPWQLLLQLHKKRNQLLYKTRRLYLWGIKGDELNRLVDTLHRYFGRHTEMRIWQAERKINAVTAQGQQP